MWVYQGNTELIESPNRKSQDFSLFKVYLGVLSWFYWEGSF